MPLDTIHPLAAPLFAPKQSNVNDVTAGAGLILGAFGLGGDLGLQALSSPDLNTIGNKTGQYYVLSATNGPPGISGSGYLTIQRYSSSFIVQTFTQDAGTVWWRGRVAGTWNAWRKVFDQLTILDTVSQSAGVPTGGVIETGSNANGVYAKFADGTLICWNDISGIGPVNVTSGALFSALAQPVWTFPSPFVITTTYPRVFGSDASSFAVWCTFATINATSATISALCYTSVGSTRTCRAVAIGRWF